MRRWLGLSWVGWLNFVVLQWFCIRLGYKRDLRLPEAERRIIGWTIVRFPVPLTGWWNEYRWIGSPPPWGKVT